MSISKLVVTPFKYFRYVANDIFINYNHNRISVADDGKSNNNYMTHVITTKIVVLNEVITIKNDNDTINLTVSLFNRSSNFPLTIIKLTDAQIEICRVVKYHLQYNRFKEGRTQYNIDPAIYNLSLLKLNKIQDVYKYVFKHDRTITNMRDFIAANKTVISTNVIFVTTEPSNRTDPIKSVNILKKNNIPSFSLSKHGSICYDIKRRCYGIVLNGALTLSNDIIKFIVEATY